jgi:hypothetical protein
MDWEDVGRKPTKWLMKVTLALLNSIQDSPDPKSEVKRATPGSDPRACDRSRAGDVLSWEAPEPTPTGAHRRNSKRDSAPSLAIAGSFVTGNARQ